MTRRIFLMFGWPLVFALLRRLARVATRRIRRPRRWVSRPVMLRARPARAYDSISPPRFPVPARLQ